MNLSELKTLIKNTSLSHQDIVSFSIGEDFEVATSKSSEQYPKVWMELPIYVNYQPAKKVFSFALDILDNSKEDDVDENFEVQSLCEIIGDQIMQKLKQDKLIATVDVVNGVTLREFSDDYLAGVRLEVEVTTSRECDIDKYFDEINIS